MKPTIIKQCVCFHIYHEKHRIRWLGNMEKLIRATNLWGYDDLVESLGGKPELFLNRFCIPTASQRPDDSFILYRNSALMLEATAIELDCPNFGLRLAKWQGLEILGAVAVIARNSETILDALTAIATYLHTHCPALSLSLIGSGNEGTLQLDYRISELSLNQLRQSYELSMANGVSILHMLLGNNSNPEAVFFMHGRVGSLESYREHFNCAVKFQQDWCGLQLPAHIVASKLDHADPQTLHYAIKYLQKDTSTISSSLSERIRKMIRRLLATGQCNANNIASDLAMHPRTLQRRLVHEQTRFEQLLDDERRLMAEGYLRESRFQMIQIAGLLGYTEQSTFTRACKRWFGMTPKKYRDQLTQIRF